MGHEAVVATLRGHDCNPDEPQDHRQVGPLGAVQESLALLIRKCELIISFTCERQNPDILADLGIRTHQNPDSKKGFHSPGLTLRTQVVINRNNSQKSG